jgi:hypothetical protein
VVGGAEASPKGLDILIPQISVERSTSSISVKNPGSYGTSGTFSPAFCWIYLCMNQEAVLPSLTASTKFLVPTASPPTNNHS